MNARRPAKMFLLPITSETLMTPHPQDGPQKSGRHASCAQGAVPVGTDIARIQQRQPPTENGREASTISCRVARLLCWVFLQHQLSTCHQHVLFRHSNAYLVHLAWTSIQPPQVTTFPISLQCMSKNVKPMFCQITGCSSDSCSTTATLSLQNSKTATLSLQIVHSSSCKFLPRVPHQQLCFMLIMLRKPCKRLCICW